MNDMSKWMGLMVFGMTFLATSGPATAAWQVQVKGTCAQCNDRGAYTGKPCSQKMVACQPPEKLGSAEVPVGPKVVYSSPGKPLSTPTSARPRRATITCERSDHTFHSTEVYLDGFSCSVWQLPGGGYASAGNNVCTNAIAHGEGNTVTMTGCVDKETN